VVRVFLFCIDLGRLIISDLCEVNAKRNHSAIESAANAHLKESLALAILYTVNNSKPAQLARPAMSAILAHYENPSHITTHT